MKALFKPAFAAGLVLAAASPLAVAPAAAQVVAGIGVIDPDAIIYNSAAYQTAQQQRPQTYRANYEQANLRRTQLDQQLEPLLQKLQTDSQAPNPNREALQQQAATIQQIRAQGQRELTDIIAPVVRSEAYVDEQITDLLPRAVEEAAKKKRVTLILNQSTGAVVLRDPAYSLNQEVIAELNTLLPVAQLVPPEGWLPREMREEQERRAAAANAAQGEAAPAQAQPAPAAAPVAPAGPPVETR